MSIVPEENGSGLSLTIYQMAAERTWRLPVERLTLYHLRSNTPCNCPPRGREQIEQTRRLIVETAENIEQGKFPALENEFCPCDFAERCPYYRHQYITAAAEAAASAAPSAAQTLSAAQTPSGTQTPLPGIAAADAVERYVGLQALIKDMEAQLEEAKQLIVEYCCQEGLNRVFGGEHEATYKLVERAGFPEDEVMKVLEPLGLWEKVTGLDQSRLKQLLADSSLPGNIRDKIESLKRITSAYPQLWLKRRAGKEE